MKKFNVLVISFSFVFSVLFYPLVTKGQEVPVKDSLLKIAAFITPDYSNNSDGAKVDNTEDTDDIVKDNNEDVDIVPVTLVLENEANEIQDKDKPLACTREYLPVCGMNGVTYSNKCVAGDVSLLHFGACAISQKPANTINYNNQTLERILSPDQIKNFKVMKNENGVLYGIRLQAQNKVEEKQAKVLEKIPAPQYINQYQDVKKIGNSLWGIKKQTAKNTTPASVNKMAVVTASIRNCVMTAIDKKDEALKTRIINNNNDLTKLITTRNSCQRQALQTDLNQKLALDICVRDFQVSSKEALSRNKEEQNKIWQNYREQLKACLPEKEILAGSDLLIEDGGSGFLEMTVN